MTENEIQLWVGSLSNRINAIAYKEADQTALRGKVDATATQAAKDQMIAQIDALLDQ